MQTAIDPRQSIRNIVAEILEIDSDAMTETSLFGADHGADSLRAIEILASLEREFKVQIPQQELERMVNLAGVYEVVKERARWSD